MKTSLLFALFAAILFSGCSASSIEEEITFSDPVWSVDLIRILPGGEDLYQKNIRGNWAQARSIAKQNGDVLSFLALRAEPDSSITWDIMLMTEYRDSISYNNRETLFDEIFQSSAFQRIEIEKPSSELREFEGGGIVLHPIASE